MRDIVQRLMDCGPCTDSDAVRAASEIVQLRAAIRKHRDERGDKQLEDYELYAVLGDTAKLVQQSMPQQKDIVERLRDGGMWYDDHEAADEIERLHAALKPFADYAGRVDPQADSRNPIDDCCPPVGHYMSDKNARPVPTLGDCRRAREVLE